MQGQGLYCILQQRLAGGVMEKRSAKVVFRVNNRGKKEGGNLNQNKTSQKHNMTGRLTPPVCACIPMPCPQVTHGSKSIKETFIDATA